MKKTLTNFFDGAVGLTSTLLANTIPFLLLGFTMVMLAYVFNIVV